MERNFQFLPEAVQVMLERGQAPAEIVAVLAEAADLARAKKRKGLLVISGVDDPATAEAVSIAIEEIHAHAPGMSEPFRIAFVAYTLPQYSVYHFAERYAPKFGIDAKVLVSLRDARAWLRAANREARGDTADTPA